MGAPQTWGPVSLSRAVPKCLMKHGPWLARAAVPLLLKEAGKGSPNNNCRRCPDKRSGKSQCPLCDVFRLFCNQLSFQDLGILDLREYGLKLKQTVILL